MYQQMDQGYKASWPTGARIRGMMNHPLGAAVKGFNGIIPKCECTHNLALYKRHEFRYSIMINKFQ